MKLGHVIYIASNNEVQIVGLVAKLDFVPRKFARHFHEGAEATALKN